MSAPSVSFTSPYREACSSDKYAAPAFFVSGEGRGFFCSLTQYDGYGKLAGREKKLLKGELL